MIDSEVPSDSSGSCPDPSLQVRERELAFHVQQYRTFISQSSEGMWRCDSLRPIPLSLPVDEQVAAIFAHSHLAECNDAMAKMHGFSHAGEMMGVPVSSFLNPHDDHAVEFLRKFIAANYRLTDHESRERGADGKVRFYSSHLMGIVRDGYLLGAWGTQRDVTEQRLAREALEKDITDRVNAEKASREAAEQARLASQAKSRFLANMSHEIRTPLGIIMGFTELALSATDPMEIRNCLEAVKRNGQLLSQIIGDVLDFSKIEASRLELESTSVSLPHLLGEIHAHLGFKAAQKGIELWIDPQAPLPENITTDPTRLRQILVNLIGNAIKFTNEGTVGLRVMSGSALEAGAPIRLRFEVEDTGIGIAKRFHKDLFQPFMQVDDSATRKFSGTGLGLMLSKQLTQALGGDLFLIESKPNQGTKFGLEIDAGIFDGQFLQPGNVRVSDPEINSERPPDPLLQKIRILSVDDSADNQLLVHHYLRPTGTKLEFASNGMEALKMVQRNDYDVILMDLQMPKMDGNEATRRLRNLGFTMPIFALTAHALHEERDRALRDGFTDYLTKPLSKASLLEALSNAATNRLQWRDQAPKNNFRSPYESSDHLCP